MAHSSSKPAILRFGGSCPPALGLASSVASQPLPATAWPSRGEAAGTGIGARVNWFAPNESQGVPSMASDNPLHPIPQPAAQVHDRQHALGQRQCAGAGHDPALARARADLLARHDGQADGGGVGLPRWSTSCATRRASTRARAGPLRRCARSRTACSRRTRRSRAGPSRTTSCCRPSRSAPCRATTTPCSISPTS